MGHTYGLCDEYDSSDWDAQNAFLFGLCPNGDRDNDNQLDSICLPGGCPTSTFQPFSGRPDSTSLNNLMGSNKTENVWIATDSYIHILNEFKHASPVFADKRIVVSEIINKSANYSIKFDNFYRIDEGLAINKSEYLTGNYSLQIFNWTNGLIYNLSFDVSFLDTFLGGNTTESNETVFVFTIPFNSSYKNFAVKRNTVIKDSRNISLNTPSLIITSSIGGRTYSNEIFNVSWSASDLDGENLTYAILLSPDNGTTFNTLTFDLNSSNYSINTLDLMDGDFYSLKILATDGINTNSTLLNTTLKIDNDLQVTNFSIVYLNNTERIFKLSLNNTLSTVIDNITLIFDNGETIQPFQYNLSLDPHEEMLFFIYHNYSGAGSYNLTFNVRSGNYVEIETRSFSI